jgi:hypothetical protein
MINEKVLPAASAEVLQRMAASGNTCFSGWTLAGGTGLALQFGHRLSEDFDFFRTDDFHPVAMHEALHALGKYETSMEDASSLVVLLDTVKLSFFKVRDPFLHPTQPWRFIQLASPEDIALMKLAAIGGRGARKDFIDLWFLLNDGRISLRDALAQMPVKYGAERFNRLHTLKSLTYFEDAEREPMPRMMVPFEWAACCAYYRKAVREIAIIGG